MHNNTLLRQGIPPDCPLWTKDFILIICINLFLFLGFQFFPSALPPYVKSLGASDATLGWLTGTATIATMLTRPLAGMLLDTLGRKGVFISGLVLMTIICAAMYFFPIVWLILALRFVHGLGWGVASTSASTIASDNIPTFRFGEGMGYFGLSASLAMAISPAIALSLEPAWMFSIATALMFISIVLAMGLHYKPVEKPDKSAGKYRPYEKAAIPPALVMFLTTTAYGALVTFLAVYAKSSGINNIGPFFTVYALIMMLTRPTVGKIIDKHGFTVVMLPSLGLIAAALIILSQSDSLMLFLCSAVLYGLGMGSMHTSAQSLAILSSPKNRVGAANATFFTGFDAGIGFGAVFGGILAEAFGYSGMFSLLAACPLSAALLFWIFSRRNKKQAS